MVTDLLKFHKADIFGLQEALFGQIKDIENALPGFGWFGTGRDDDDKAGEFSPIFYNKDLFNLIENGQFWLSETPDKPGLGWDAACNRVCVWGKFEQKETGRHFFVFNTHFDHKGDTARANSAKLILKFIAEKKLKENLPVILTGDFNLTPDQLPILLIKKDLSDCRDISVEQPYGPVGTFNAFQPDSPLDRRIDYIFVNNKVKVIKFAILTDSKDNRYPSDHLPVFVKIVLK
jgi:endonuclease/exonuclease/phosphatase family metal-dependent hydrolase